MNRHTDKTLNEDFDKDLPSCSFGVVKDVKLSSDIGKQCVKARPTMCEPFACALHPLACANTRLPTYVN